MKHLQIASTLALLSIAFEIAGCLSFRAGDLEPLPTRQLQSDARPSIAITVTGSSGTMAQNGQPVSWPLLESWTETVLEMYRESGLFSEVRTGFFEADLRAKVELRQSSDANLFLAFLSVFTASVIPLYSTGALGMNTVFQDRNLEEITTIWRRERLSHWGGILLLPLTPFFGASTVTEETIKDLTRSTLGGASEVLLSGEDRPVWNAAGPDSL